jgi:hypothetical protein
LEDTSQQVDKGTSGEKICFSTSVIVMIGNIERDKQLTTADRLKSQEAINLSQVIVRINSKTINLS